MRPPRNGRAIDACGLHKSYHSRAAIDSLSFVVEAGTVVGLLGPNGAGKTTLLRILSTMLTPDAGNFAVAGVPYSQPVEIRRRIGVLPENPGYPGTQTAQDWLVYHARLFGVSRGIAEDTAQRLLADVGLIERGSSAIHSLSRGMRQRLAIARSLVNDPAVLFLDEPTLGLDPGGQRQVLDLVARIAGEREVTVVVSTHTLAEVEQICSRVLILDKGRLVADGSVAEIIRQAPQARRAVLRIPSLLRHHAVAALVRQGVAAADPVSGRREDELVVVLPADQTLEQSSKALLSVLLAADVPVLGLALEGGGLSDAFLEVTGGPAP